MMWLYIAGGGALGAVLRYWLTSFSLWRFGISMPATFSVNVIGAFVLGFVLALINLRSHQGLTPQAAVNAFVFFEFGLLGGFTTFSTYILEFQSMLREKPVKAFLYMNASVLLSVFAIAMGYFIGAGGYFG